MICSLDEYPLMRSVLLLITALLLSTAPAQAEKIYRWTDADGQVHFGSQPPREVNLQAESVELRVQRGATPASTVPTQPKATTEAGQAEATTGKPVALQPSVSKEQAEKNCQQAREYKQALNEAANRRFQMPDGSFRPLTSAERDEQNKDVDELIRQYCR